MSHNLKVLHLAEILQGGVGTCMDEIIKAQIECYGPENVRVLVPGSQAVYLASIPKECIETYNRTGRNPKSLAALGATTFRLASQFKPTIAHIHSTFAGVVCRPVLAMCRPRPRLVYCAHGWSFLMGETGAKLRLYTIVERLLSPLTDLVIALSQNEYDEAIKRGLKPKNWTILPNGIEDRPVPPRQLQDDGPLRLLFVGVFRPQKGLDLLLKVMERVQDAPLHLDIIGAGLDMQNNIHLPDNVTAHGWMNRDEIDQFYARADAVIMPSRWEACSMVALETMRAGVALIASRRGTLPELVDEGRTGMLFDLKEDDLSNLENTLRALDRAALREMGKAARERYKSFFAASRMNSALFQLYSDLQRGVSPPLLSPSIETNPSS